MLDIKKKKENEFCCCVEDGLKESKGGAKKPVRRLWLCPGEKGWWPRTVVAEKTVVRRWDSGCGWGQQPGRVVGRGL